MTQTVLITGANGGLGRLMRPRLARPGRTLRLLDLVAPEAPGDGEAVEVLVGSVTDAKAMRDACTGVDAVIHLGGISVEAPWQDILTNNIDGTRVMLEEARAAGVARVVLASSNHAVGFYGRDDAGPDGLPADIPPRPDTYYGFSKAAQEALGALFHSRYGMDVTCLRIGSCFEKPWDSRSLWTWMSPDDGARLLEACLATPEPGFRTVWGISRNTRRWWSLKAGEQIGYHPQDDSEVFAQEILAGVDESAPGAHERFVGGKFCFTELGAHQR
ncbi:NAD(P)-dependent oxidoreductase [Mycobacterium sp. 21AC1]|uniref:NAD-dependent epimerase/dehydratase family protein n=1 Tax=[Mycobacterium] appelbergii TaxID=2939269 RepID=UPI002939438E|nr:NAD(P)-dependent oxidoreductase [Mycobacterium sp. 21AC1]MDV3123489.1 NAD(P)-dependent oxidoreductase [Mycobacterium sp. 21AC1]